MSFSTLRDFNNRPNLTTVLSRQLADGQQVLHLGHHLALQHRGAGKFVEFDDSGKPHPAAETHRSRWSRMVRAWQWVRLRREIARLIHPVDRLEIYHPPLKPSFFRQLPQSVQRKFSPWVYGSSHPFGGSSHPFGLHRSEYESFRIWPGTLVASEREINQAIDVERLRRVKKTLRAQAPRNLIGIRSTRKHLQRQVFHPRPERRAR